MAQKATIEASPAKTVLIIDDHVVVRCGVRFLIEGRPGFEVCGEDSEVQKALDSLGGTVPNLVILDFVLGGRDGYNSVSEVRKALPFSAILIYSVSPEELFAQRSLKCGANGYLMKTHNSSEFYRAVDTVLAGDVYLSPKMVKRVLTGIEGASAGYDYSTLSERELQVFQRLGEGKTTGEIARELQLSVKTIATHRENLKYKLGITSGAELARQAITYVLQQGKTDQLE